MMGLGGVLDAEVIRPLAGTGTGAPEAVVPTGPSEDLAFENRRLKAELAALTAAVANLNALGKG